ncbi:hypothetical protein EDB85DRAFT_2072598 [Lactarius pseudohatsudake]|nr:hypothetical protein EDB85DRAFT_2072598 [Lactarius pseudohatsudake]
MSDEAVGVSQQNFCDVAEEMTKSMVSVRELIQALRKKQETTADFEFKDGISLLSLKHQLLLSYMQSLVLLHSHRVLGHSLTTRSPPSQSFNSPERGSRGVDAGDLVDSMIEGRIVFEKTKLLESKMRYQIEKLVQLAAEDASDDKVVNDPLAFRPNPEALMGAGPDDDGGTDGESQDEIYRPPKLAPMPYIEPTTKEARARRPPPAHALASLAHLDPEQPFLESATGLGIVPSLQSARARELRRMEEFEEENMTRLDEEDIALGGAGGIVGKRRGGGLEDEFADVLRDERRGKTSAGDGYDELRTKGRKEGALARSRVRGREDGEDTIEGQKQRKKGRFERDVRVAKKRWARKQKRK